MDENIKMILDEADSMMEKAVNHLESELQKVRAGKANPVMLDGLKVDYYGAPTPVNQIANVSAPEARLLVIQPFEKSMIHPIERAIKEANLGFNPQNDGAVIRIPIPPLSEERRKGLVKQAKDEGEKAKVAVRNIRRDNNEALKNLKKEGIAEDEIKLGETDMQKLTDVFIHKIDEVLKKKEQEIMTV